MPASLEQFEAVFPGLVKDIVQEIALPPHTLQWFEKVCVCQFPSIQGAYFDACFKSLFHNTVGGKCNRGLSVIDTTEILLGRPLTQEEYFQSATLGWMIELFQGFMLVMDDIMDASKTRRGRSCWYLVPGVGMIAINDAVMLESSIYILMKRHFRRHPSYLQMMELFHEISWKTEVGQSCDLITAPEGADIERYTMQQYGFIVEHKTAYYSFYLSISLALLYLGKASDHSLKVVREIALPMGDYFQVQDDFLDAFGDPEVLGKVGTDIADNKCSWLVIKAMEKCTQTQLGTLKSNYGRKDSESQERVRMLYKLLELDTVYRDYEATTVAELDRRVAAVDETEGLRREIFQAFLDKIRNRTR